MKKSKILLILAALLVAAMLLTSCGGAKIGTINNLSKYLNTEYDLSYDSIVSGKTVSGLEGYSVDENMTTDEFVFLYKLSTDDEPKVYHKVLSLASGEIILNFTADKDTQYVFETSSSPNAIFVKEYELDTKKIDTETNPMLAALVAAFADGSISIGELLESDIKDNISTTYTLYDSTGANIASTDDMDSFYNYADLIVYNYVAYSENEADGKLVEAAKVPEYIDLGDCSDYTDDYYYDMATFEDFTSKVTVYDKSFNTVFVWTANNYSDDSVYENSNTVCVLNNGDILIQYMLVLDEDAEDYDVSIVKNGVTSKLDLVSELITLKNKKTTQLDLDYVVYELMRNSELYDDEEEAAENYFNNDFENLAFIYPVVDKKISYGYYDLDLVIMDNKAKAQKSVKINDLQTANFAEKIGDDVFMISTIDGNTTFINSKGKLLTSFSGDLEVCGSYLVGEAAIYNFSLEVVYDLRANDATCVACVGDTVFVKVKLSDTSANKYDVLSLCNGEEKTVYTYDKKKSFDITEFGYVIIEEDNYTYYNEKGEKLITTSLALEYVADSYDNETFLYVSIPAGSDDKPNYYFFAK